MILPEFEYLAPETLDEACAMLGRFGADAKVLAGGSDLVVKMKHGLIKPRYLVSLKNLNDLRGVRLEPGVGVVIGSRTTHNQMAQSPILKERFASIPGAASTMAANQICNIGTVGGNMVNAVPSADMPPILIALGAVARIHGPAGERSVPVEDFFTGPGKTVLAGDEILKEIVIPDQATTGSKYIKFGLRRAGALAVVGVAVAVTMEGEIVKDCRIVLGAVAPVPMRASGAEELMKGKKPTRELYKIVGDKAAEEAKPINDIRGSVEYRRNLVGVLTKRALRSAVESGHC